jgi:predicted ATPase
METTVELAQELSHPYTLVAALAWSAWLHLYRREAQLAQARAETAIALAKKHDLPYWLTHSIALWGWSLVQQGRVVDGVARLRESLSTRQAIGALLYRPTFLGLLAEGYAKGGEPEQGLRVLEEALHRVEATGERLSEVELHRLKGELLLLQGAKEQEVESCLLRALNLARQQETKSLELRAAMSLARLWQYQGKRQTAHNLLAEIYGWFTEGFDTPDLQDARALLATLSA